MKRIALFLVLAGVAFAGCKKTADVSKEVTVSYPVVTITGSPFYSIPVGGTVPSATATAYDSTLQESYPVDFDLASVDNNTPGLYVVTATAKNKNGYTGTNVVYIAVTNVPASTDLSGTYIRSANGAVVHVTKILTGLYSTDDVGGAPTLPVLAYFAHLDDVTIVVPPQPTSVGTLSCDNASLHMAAGDTSFSYVVVNGNFGTALRTFVKQ
ncbi:hypothetical protein [Taibaiella soli]|uniref:Pesticidal crystal protein Cry22Aa Ig-like domain-containing protein n=1 Tax=Taibaiella soli TaxID=1649169 RepID=A0A2W2ACJ3_9BACT|nr:hypothetical protein [Taibaiella soli]PZF73011.1 hypothetical protein DN068_11420 [Taibaiella soli]